ncbi:MAG: hypothetical protein MJ252_10085, partial [archaeon]|nr:hypothetical protein [archaeon]
EKKEKILKDSIKKILQIASISINLDNPIKYKIILKIIKIFIKSLEQKIPSAYLNKEIMDSMVKLILSLIDKENNSQKEEEDFRKIKLNDYKFILSTLEKFLGRLNTQDAISFKEGYIKNIYLKVKQIYLDDISKKNIKDKDILTHIYKIFNYLLNKNIFTEDILPLFVKENITKEKIISDCFINPEEVRLIKENPNEYVLKKNEESYNINEDTLRKEASSFYSSLMNFNENETQNSNIKVNQPSQCFQHFFDFLITNLQKANSYQQNENYLFIKESIMYILQRNSLSLILIYPNYMEEIIANCICQEFNSSFEIMKEKALVFISKFSQMKFTNQNLIENILRKICNILENEKNIPILIEASICISNFTSQKVTKDLMKDNLKIIFSILVNILYKTESDDILDCIHKIVNAFPLESKNLVVKLCKYLFQYFYKIYIKSSEEGMLLEENITGLNQILFIFSDIFTYYIKDEKIIKNLIPYIDLILTFCLVKNYDKFSEGLEILHLLLKNCIQIPNFLWKFYFIVIKSVIGTNEEKQNFSLINPNQTFEGFGYEYLDTICKIIYLYITKGINAFLDSMNKRDNLFTSAFKFVENSIEILENRKEEEKLFFPFEIIESLFSSFPGRINDFYQRILNFILNQIKSNKTENSEIKRYFIFLISSSINYNPLKTCNYFYTNIGEESFFDFYLTEIEKIKSNRIKRENLKALSNLILFDSQNHFINPQNIKRIIEICLQIISSALGYNTINIQNKNTKEEEDDLEELSESYSEEESDLNEKDDLIKEIKRFFEILKQIENKNNIYFKDLITLIGTQNVEIIKNLYNVVDSQ